jgi:hypothetical protein
VDLPVEILRRSFEEVGPVLDGRLRQLVAAALEAFGRGGTTWVTEAAGLSRNTGRGPPVVATGRSW